VTERAFSPSESKKAISGYTGRRGSLFERFALFSEKAPAWGRDVERRA
jgi:hypothetical protein